ncbi:hemolymph lipopolysaccharide-binding protein [Diachasma alloeum]|uniref:hemolymph lipopolysaccharide-binding protein n=1 Tax=Diachasma alloeum TaxID=454923 RepID=UPI0007383130|nr:hemolymph lipopolysaccharide-binding protein [Diachasma alloeum]
MITKCITGFALIALLSVTRASSVENQCPPTATGFVVNSLQGNGYSIRASTRANEFYVNIVNGIQLRIFVAQNGFLVNGTDARGGKLTVNANDGRVEFVAPSPGSTAKKPCESQKFPEGYTATEGIGAHKYHKTKKTWNDARNTCIDEGGHLAVITSDAEEKLILNMVNAVKYDDTWLGVHDLFAFRDWVTVQGVRLNATGYARWSPRISPNPDNYGGNQRCVRLLNSGGMDDIQCSSYISFVCKIQCDTCPANTSLLVPTKAH